MIKYGEVVGYVSGKGFRDVVLEDVLKMFEEKSRIKLIKLPSHLRSQMDNIINRKDISKIAIAQTTDLIAYKIINTILNKSAKNLGDVAPTESKVIKPLYLFLDKEVLLYAKIKKLKFEKIKEKEDEIGKFINELEKKHPEVKRAVVKGCLKIDD